MDYFENKMKGHEYYEMARCCAFGWGVKKTLKKLLNYVKKLLNKDMRERNIV